MAIHGNSFRFLPFHSPNVHINQLHRHIQNIIPEKSGRQVVDGGRNAAPPLQLRTQPLRPHRRGGCCVVGGRQRRQQLRPDASGSRPRAHCTGSGGGASSRMAAELRRIVSPPDHHQPPADAPNYRKEMRERSGSHGRQRYALRQGQRLPAAGLAQPEPQYQPGCPTGFERLRNGAADPARAPDLLLATLSTLRPCASFRPLSRSSTMHQSRFTDRLQTNP